VSPKAITWAALAGVLGCLATGFGVWRGVRTGIEQRAAKEMEQAIKMEVMQRDLRALEGKVWIELNDHEGRLRGLEAQ